MRTERRNGRRKKQKNKKERQANRAYAKLAHDPKALKTEIEKIKAYATNGELDARNTRKLRQLVTTQANIERQENAERLAREKEEAEAAAKAPPKRERQPEDSVYYDPVLNPYGTPPPGHPELYKDDIAGDVMVPPPPPPRPAMGLVPPPPPPRHTAQHPVYQPGMALAGLLPPPMALAGLVPPPPPPRPGQPMYHAAPHGVLVPPPPPPRPSAATMLVGIAPPPPPPRRPQTTNPNQFQPPPPPRNQIGYSGPANPAGQPPPPPPRTTGVMQAAEKPAPLPAAPKVVKIDSSQFAGLVPSALRVRRRPPRRKRVAASGKLMAKVARRRLMKNRIPAPPPRPPRRPVATSAEDKLDSFFADLLQST